MTPSTTDVLVPIPDTTTGGNMTMTATATAVRAKLASAGTTISAQRAQDILFSLWDDAGPWRGAVESLLTLTQSRLWFKSEELESLLASIETNVTLTQHSQ